MKMGNFFCCILLTAFFPLISIAQEPMDSVFQIRGFCIAAPKPQQVGRFVQFISEELAPRKVNTLVLRVDWNYQYQSHPELRDSNALSKADVARILTVAKQHGMSIIPQVNLLGHQSWAGTIHNLLRVYPQFDETPQVKMPAKYQWPNADSLYCKSYCPQHPDLHKIVFELVDEICDVFEAKAFHAGMDEVFYIGSPQCPRCAGKDKAMLFAGEVNKIQEHLKKSNRKLWIWGDRLIDGKTTGIGMWEGSFNNTWPAIDVISKEVVICDWHYERPDPTAVYFAMKGFQVITCPWRNPQIAVQQTKQMRQFRLSSTKEMKSRYLGMMQTVWSGADGFMTEYYSKKDNLQSTEQSPVLSFIKMYNEINTPGF